ncbi:alpha/beta hydrolase [Roseomonas sp. USHLN139]|uniref:alpha/beta hydrolase n=1 Tax=Roseomonas sp. USHLN139 TaxID=3081298 RepID=UPI003B0297D6
MPPVSLPGTQVLEIPGGWQLWLAVPDAPAPPAGFPVVWLLDANACFGTALETLRISAARQKVTRMAPAILAGIAYPTEGGFDRARRGFDYTAGPPSEEPHRGASGGRDGFRDMLRDLARPLVARQAPIDPARQIIIGHSLAGNLVLDLLAHDRALFSGYGALSPSIWWDRPRLLRGLAKTADARPDVFLAVGEWEEGLAPWEAGLPGAEEIAARRGRRGMVSNLREMATVLGSCLPQARIQAEVCAGETHASMLPLGLLRSLRFLLASDAQVFLEERAVGEQRL